jgi:hypothetical protein
MKNRTHITSRWVSTCAIVAYMMHTKDTEMCEASPFFSLARAMLLDVTFGEHMIPTAKRYTGEVV